VPLGCGSNPLFDDIVGSSEDAWRLGPYQTAGNAPLSAMMGRLSRNQGQLVRSRRGGARLEDHQVRRIADVLDLSSDAPQSSP